MAEPQDPSAAVPTNPTVGAGSTGPDRSGVAGDTVHRNR